MLRRSELMQFEIGMSTKRYFPARGTAGLARSLVSGNRRVPAPPPRITLKTFFVLMVIGGPFPNIRVYVLISSGPCRSTVPRCSALAKFPAHEVSRLPKNEKTEKSRYTTGSSRSPTLAGQWTHRRKGLGAFPSFPSLPGLRRRQWLGFAVRR